MTIISPYQRQLVFTRSFLTASKRQSEPKRGMIWRLREFWSVETSQRAVPTYGVCAVCSIMVLAIFVFGVQAVLTSFEKNILAEKLDGARLERETLELRMAELLSPDALRTYANMVQLSQPGSIQYISPQAPVLAQNAAAPRFAP